VVDTVDAVTSDRPYRQGRSLEAAEEELRASAGTQLDPACVEAFQQVEHKAIRTRLQHGSNPRYELLSTR
jgi:HD-GYP domain-containing protein (c-di-GMP phosphodiesterase class II)